MFLEKFIHLKIKFDNNLELFPLTKQTTGGITVWRNKLIPAKLNKNYLVSLIPALFMTSVSVTYIMIAPEGFSLAPAISYVVGISSMVVTFIMFIMWKRRYQPAML